MDARFTTETILDLVICCPKKSTFTIIIFRLAFSLSLTLPVTYYNLQDLTDPVCHIFKSDSSPDEEAFSVSAWLAHKRPVRIPRNEIHLALAEWHYRHCVISAWGSAILKPRVHPSFCECEDNLGSLASTIWTMIIWSSWRLILTTHTAKAGQRKPRAVQGRFKELSEGTRQVER